MKQIENRHPSLLTIEQDEKSATFSPCNSRLKIVAMLNPEGYSYVLKIWPGKNGKVETLKRKDGRVAFRALHVAIKFAHDTALKIAQE